MEHCASGSEKRREKNWSLVVIGAGEGLSIGCSWVLVLKRTGTRQLDGSRTGSARWPARERSPVRRGRARSRPRDNIAPSPEPFAQHVPSTSSVNQFRPVVQVARISTQRRLTNILPSFPTANNYGQFNYLPHASSLSPLSRPSCHHPARKLDRLRHLVLASTRSSVIRVHRALHDAAHTRAAPGAEPRTRRKGLHERGGRPPSGR